MLTGRNSIGVIPSLLAKNRTALKTKCKLPKPIKKKSIKLPLRKVPVDEKPPHFDANMIIAETARLSTFKHYSLDGTAFAQGVLNCFDGLMAYLHKDPVVTTDTLISFISHLSLAKYSNAYIRTLFNCLKSHHSCQGKVAEIFDCQNVQRILRKAGTAPLTEDNRIPLSKPLIQQMCAIFDRDFNPYMAIMLKAMVWLGTCCMLRVSELAGTGTGIDCVAHRDHSIQFEDFAMFTHPKYPSISLTMKSWKHSARGKTLYFPIQQYFLPVLTWMERYLVLWGDAPGPLFKLETGHHNDLYPLFNCAFAHAVDHTEWFGLSISSHSMRIAGATWHYEENVDPFHIVRLGRWGSSSILRYFREAWLQDPHSMRLTGKFAMGRRSVFHQFCACPPNFGAANEQQLQKDTLLNCTHNAARALAGIGPDTVHTVHSLIKEGHRANPIVKEYQNWDDKAPLVWLYQNYQGDHTWFSLAVYCAQTKLMYRKFDAKFTSKGPTKDVVYLPNTQVISPYDKAKARWALFEYCHFIEMATEACWEKLNQIQIPPNFAVIFPEYIAVHPAELQFHPVPSSPIW